MHRWDQTDELGKTKVMRYIEWYLGMYGGKSPAIRAICNATGLTSTETVQAILKELDEEGFIRYNPKYKVRKEERTTGITLTHKRYFEHVETTPRP